MRGKELELSNVQEMCPWNNRSAEQVAVRHADASGSDITENQHEENRMRDIQVGNTGSEAASDEQRDKLRKTAQFEQEAPSAAASSNPTVALEYFASGETQSRPECVLVQKSGHVEGWTKESLHRRNVGLVSKEEMPEISREPTEMNWLRI